MYSSQPSSPTYVTRVARTIAYPSSISRDVPNGNAAFEKVVRAHAPQQLARPRPLDVQHRERRGDVRDRCAGVRRDLRVEPGAVAALVGRSADDEEAPVVEAGHGHVGFDAAAIVQPLRVHEPAGLDGNVVGADPAQDRLGVAALDELLPEAGLVEQADGLADRVVLASRALEPVLALVAVLVARRDAIDGVPVRALPPGRLAEDRARRRELPVERRAAHAPRGLDLAERPVHVVQQAEDLRRAVVEVAAIHLERHEPSDVDLGKVHRWVAVDDPVGDRATRAGPGLESDRVEARGHEIAPELGAGPRMYRSSGVKLSGPLKNSLMPASAGAARGGRPSRRTARGGPSRPATGRT